jgi:hypothetical protein
MQYHQAERSTSPIPAKRRFPEWGVRMQGREKKKAKRYIGECEAKEKKTEQLEP